MKEKQNYNINLIFIFFIEAIRRILFKMYFSFQFLLILRVYEILSKKVWKNKW